MNRLSRRIIGELNSINAALERANKGWQKFQQSTDDLYVDSVALSFQSAYTGLERLFELIVREIDGNRPDGINWHQQLLEQMALEVPSVRPAVLSASSVEQLNEYRKFRHLVRHIYPDEFEANKVELLINASQSTFEQVALELQNFAQFLEQQSS